MPLSFLNPGLLLGAVAAALPVVLHFLSRRRARRESFSDLRFLEQARAGQARSLGVRRWLLLLLRVLALLLVVAGAAGPRWGGLGSADGAGSSYLLIIDVSASAGARRGTGTVLEAARREAADLVRQLPAGAAVQVIVASGRAEALFGDWLPAGEAAAAALADIQPTDGGFDLASVLREASRQAARAPGSPVNLILFGDLQEPAADAEAEQAAVALRGAREVHVLLREVAPDRGPAGGVVAVQVPTRALRPGETATVKATVVPARTGQVFALELDGTTVAEAVAAGPPGQAAELEFAVAVPGPGLHAGWVRTESDIMAADDRRPFVLAVPPRLGVLVVHGPDRAGDGAAGRGGWRYLAQALAPGGDSGAFMVTARASDEVTTEALATAGVIALVDPGPLGRSGLDALAGRLATGGGILLAAGDPLVSQHLDQVLLPALGLPGPAPAVAAAGTGVHARIVDVSHPLLAGLDDAARRALEDVRWRRWLAHPIEGSRVVLELAGGQPLLIEREAGPGRLAVLATHLGPDAGDFARSPMAVPLLQRTCSWLGGGSAQDGAGTSLAGRPTGVRPRPGIPSAALAAGVIATGPVAGQGAAVELEWRDGLPWLAAGPVDRAGFVAFLAAADTVGLVAVGVPPEETLRPHEGGDGWRRRLGALGLTVAAPSSGDGSATLAAALAGRDLAPWAFLLAVVLLAIELAAGTGRSRRGS
ncbi:MAG: VWA domain-containing protein [bacterium]|nr:VWA domain-containing protein [bacterium]